MKKQWKGFFVGFVLAATLFSLESTAWGAMVGKTIEVFTGVNIYIDDVKLNPVDPNGNPIEAFIYNGTTYLPVRAVGEAVGKVVQWEGKTSSVYLGRHTGEKPAVWLKDLDYFMGDKFITLSSDKDNLGQTRTNCIIGKSYLGSGSSDYYWNNTYKINGQYRLISGTLYQRYDYRSAESKGSLKIYGDGNLLYEATMDRGVEPIDFSVDIQGVLELRIEYRAEESWGLSVGTAIADCGLWT